MKKVGNYIEDIRGRISPGELEGRKEEMNMYLISKKTFFKYYTQLKMK